MTRRLPFGPSRMAAKQRDASRGANEAPASPLVSAPPGLVSASQGVMVWSVGTLATHLSQAITLAIPGTIHVSGEVSGFRERTHWYFDLKDAEASIGCVMFASAWRKAGLDLRDGMALVVSGRLDFYAKQGKTSLIVESLRPAGEGAQDAAFRRLCEELRAAGWFDDARKRTLPAFPRRIAVLTSRSGAAFQDVLDTLRRRCPAIEVVLLDVRVQGEGAAGEVASAVRWCSANGARLGIDAAILTRGGGSKEDLWAFNDRELARAIVESRVPIVAAIGHETDTTIAELVADVRAATPTQAAMRVSPDSRAMLEQLSTLRARATRAMEQSIASRVREREHSVRHLGSAIGTRLASAARELERIGGRLAAGHPRAGLMARRTRLDAAERELREAFEWRLKHFDFVSLTEELHDAMAGRLRQERERVAYATRSLEVVGPTSVLARGYSVTMRSDGRVVRSRFDVSEGDELRTLVSDGEIGSRVEGEGEVRRRHDDSTKGMVLSESSQEPADPHGIGRVKSRRRTKNTNHGPSLFERVDEL